MEAEQLLLASYHTLAGAKNWYHRTLGKQNLRDLVALYESWESEPKRRDFGRYCRSECGSNDFRATVSRTTD